MGVIYGYISLTDKPLDPAITEAMRKANSFWEPDGDGLWQDERAAMGSLIMFNTPEAIFERQPIHFEEGRKVLVATARIDNRDDLCRAFNIPLSARDMYPDSYYIRLAYEKWGEDCPDHLIGDWSFAVWDKVNRKLFVARDHHGIMACYYYKGPDFFVFSSSLKGILCLPQVPKRVNEYKIAQILVNWNEGGPPTCYEDIFRLPPSHTITLKDGNVSTNRYWYLEHTPEIHLKNDQEYIDMFRDLYTEAVRCRLRSYRPVGATLSGGLDSGSLCILAAKELAKYGKRLPAFTAVPLYDVPWPKNRIGDEGPLALALAEKLGNVDVTLCKAENISPLEGIEKMMEVYHQPDFVAKNAYWIYDMVSICNSQGIGTLLNCQNGNLTITWPSNSIQKYKKKPLVSLISFILKAPKLYYSLNQLPINKNLSQKYNIPQALFKNHFEFFLKIRNNQLRLVALKPGLSDIGTKWFELGLSKKIEARDPSIDIKLTSFLISIPKNSIYSLTRELFNCNFKDYFPNEIINKNIRGIQAMDVLKRAEYEDIPTRNQSCNLKHIENWLELKKQCNSNHYKKNYPNLDNLIRYYPVYLFPKNL